ncbi:MAG: polysaccharide deacetylase family protein [Tumebacillaceae bacterium]
MGEMEMIRKGRIQVSKHTVVVAVPLLLGALGSAGCTHVTASSAPMQTVHAMTQTPQVKVEPTTQEKTQETAATPAVPISATPIHDSRPMPPVTESVDKRKTVAATAAVPPVPPANQAQVVYYNGGKSSKLVALTFDDGPDNRYTAKILDILKENNVKATFFVVGVHAKEYPDLVRRIVDEGNAIGNHSWDHGQLSKMNKTQVQSEIDRADQQLFSILGFHPALFRPPYGETTKDAVQECRDNGYKLIDWSVDTRDWAGAPTPQIMKTVNAQLYPGGIILQHSAGGKNGDLNNTVAATQEMIQTLKAQGYQFVTVPQLLGIPESR